MTRATRRWWLYTGAAALATALGFGAVEVAQDDRCFLQVCDGYGPLTSASRQHRAAEVVLRRAWTAAATADDLRVAAELLARASSRDSLVFAFGADISDSVRRTVRHAIERERAGRLQWQSRGRVAVVVASDTATTRVVGTDRRVRRPSGAWVSVRAVPPNSAFDGRCVVIVRLRGKGLITGVRWNPEIPLMDACSFIDAFGPPGPAIAAALDSGEYRAARIFAPSLPDSLANRRRVALMWAYVPGQAMLGCIRNEPGACAQEFNAGISWTSRGTFEQLGYIAPTVTVTGSQQSPSPRNMAFDALAAELGLEAFDRFWRSDLPLPAAFQAVSSRSLDSTIATRRRLFDEYAPTHGFGSRIATRPAATVGSSVLAIACIVGLGFVAARFAPRRLTIG